MKRKKLFIIVAIIAVITLGVNYYLKSRNNSIVKADNQYQAFIPNVGYGTISVIDVENQELMNTIKIEKEVSHGIETTPDGSRFYTGDLDKGKLFV